MRIVLDSNVLVSALITKGTPPDRLYQAWLRSEIELVTCAAQIDELADVLSRPNLRKYVDRTDAAQFGCGYPPASNCGPRHADSDSFSGPEGRRHSHCGRCRRSRTRSIWRQTGNSGAAGGRGNSKPHPARSAPNRACPVSHPVPVKSVPPAFRTAYGFSQRTRHAARIHLPHHPAEETRTDTRGRGLDCGAGCQGDASDGGQQSGTAPGPSTRLLSPMPVPRKPAPAAGIR